MPTRWQTFPIKLEGGLVTNLGRIEQGISAPGSATILQNFEADVEGGYTRVRGYQKYSTTEVPGTGLIRGVVALSGTEVLVERQGQFYYSTGTTWTSKLALTNASITRVKSTTFNYSGVVKTVVVDGVNAPSVFNHNTKAMAYLTSPPADVVGASRVVSFKSHLFFAKGNLLSFTQPYDETGFDPGLGAGVINVGDTITGLTIFRDQLIIFCLNKIQRLSGSSVSDFVLSPITNNTGCLCGETVQEVGGDIMYLGPDGIRYLSASERENDFGLNRASDKIQKQVLDITNTNCLYSSVTLASKNQYRLFYYLDNVVQANSRGFVSTKFSNQTIEDISWATLKGFKVYSLDKFQNRDLENIFFSSDTGFVYRMESGNSFDGVDIEAIFETPYMPLNDPKIRKTFYKHTLFAKSAGGVSLFCRLKFDYVQPDSSTPRAFSVTASGGTAVYGDLFSTYGGAVYSAPIEEQFYNNIIGSGFVVALRYYNKSQSPPFNLNFVVLEYRPNERN